MVPGLWGITSHFHPGPHEFSRGLKAGHVENHSLGSEGHTGDTAHGPLLSKCRQGCSSQIGGWGGVPTQSTPGAGAEAGTGQQKGGCRPVSGKCTPSSTETAWVMESRCPSAPPGPARVLSFSPSPSSPPLPQDDPHSPSPPPADPGGGLAFSLSPNSLSALLGKRHSGERLPPTASCLFLEAPHQGSVAPCSVPWKSGRKRDVD